MALISIARCLWFEETALGATLNFRSPDDSRALLFRVGISYDSLQDCNNALRSACCLWTIQDGSLTVYGDKEELSLTFCSTQGKFQEMGISLYGEELSAFKTAVNAFACRLQTNLN